MLDSMMLFAASIFVSAFLLFLVQPMVGKHILPWFGGGPGVWTLCLTFYQSTLFLGYAYAHGLIRFVPAPRQVFVHAGIFVSALWVLPVLPDATWQPEPGADPSARILMTLAANVGAPFFLLASTGPLVQAWFSRAFSNRTPYPLYAASNLGSLLALLCFPIFVEPYFPLSQTSSVWSLGFAFCGAAILGCAWRAREPQGSLHEGGSIAEPRPAGVSVKLLWVGLAAVGVVLLLGVTNELCLDVVSLPFLWALPLSIYLATFIVCFSSERMYRRSVFSLLAALSMSILFAVWLTMDGRGWQAPGSGSILLRITVYSITLFACCMLAHGELYRLRPEPSRLTEYYLCISGGGALGGLFVGIAAPRLFVDYYELPIGLVACGLLFLAAYWRDSEGLFQASSRREAWRGLAVTCAIGLLVVVAIVVGSRRPSTLLQERNFFGVLVVSELSANDPPRYQRELSSGTTLHGAQLVRPAPRQPTTYFGRYTGIGFVMESRMPDRTMLVDIVGLGIGTLAAYGRSGDRFRFYEIDPNVIRIAQDEAYFTFLSDSPAEVEIIPGDARLSFRSPLDAGPDDLADLLVLDAFNSDAIPVHLLTREAFELYKSRIERKGVIALHLSSRNLDLVPLGFRLADDAGLHAVAIANEEHNLSFKSDWVIMSRDAAYLDALVKRACSVAAPVAVYFPNPAGLVDTPLWSDDYSDLFRILAPISRSMGVSAKGRNACKSASL